MSGGSCPRTHVGFDIVARAPRRPSGAAIVNPNFPTGSIRLHCFNSEMLRRHPINWLARNTVELDEL